MKALMALNLYKINRATRGGRRKGITFAEVVLAMMVLMIIIVSVFSVFTMTTSAIVNSREKERNIMAVLSALERAEGVDFNKLTAGTYKHTERIGGTTIITTVPSKTSKSAVISTTATWKSAKGDALNLTLTREVSLYAEKNTNETPK